jgi:hypothetical protein
MNLSTKTLGLILLLALIQFSCTDFSEVGQDLVQDQVVPLTVAEVPVESAVVLLDSIPTNGAFFTGTFEDETFGRISTTAFSQLGIDIDDLPDPELVQTGQFLSFNLVLPTNPEIFYGNFPANQTIELHELSELITENDTFRTHYSFQEVPYEPEVIGSYNQTVTASMDSIVIPFNDQIGREFFSRLDTTTEKAFTNADNFYDFFKGLAVVSSGSNILAFDQANSRATIRYQVIRGGVVQDTASFSFGLQAVFSQITNELTGTALAGAPESQPFLPDDGLIYTQVGTGISAQLDMTSLLEFSDTAGNIVVNQAQLIIGPVVEAEGFTPPPSLNLFYSNDEGEILKDSITGLQRVFPSGQSLASPTGQGPVFSLIYDEESRTYTGDVSVFLQDLNRGREFPSLQFLLNNIDLSESLRRLRVRPEDIKVEVFYSTVSQ